MLGLATLKEAEWFDAAAPSTAAASSRARRSRPLAFACLGRRKTSSEVAGELDVAPSTVVRTAHRYAKPGIAGLYDRRRDRGNPKVDTSTSASGCGELGKVGAAVAAEGKVSINGVNEQNLRRLPGIGATRAKAIPALRSGRGASRGRRIYCG